MKFSMIIVVFLIQTCTTSVLFRITGKNKYKKMVPSYLFGTAHVPNKLVWPFFSNNTLDVLNNSDEYWFEHDLTSPRIYEFAMSCGYERLPRKTKALLRSKTWSLFMRRNKTLSSVKLTKKNKSVEWKKWFIHERMKTLQDFRSNQTIDENTMLDLRIILEAYQRKKVVGSLETLPKDCSMFKAVDIPNGMISHYLSLFADAYNCDLINEHFVQAMHVYYQVLLVEKRNKEITKNIRKLLKKNPRKTHVFAIGAGHLFGNTSVVYMLEKQFPKDYHIEKIESPSANYSAESCVETKVLLQAAIESMSINISTTKEFNTVKSLNLAIV